jgi:hypothetical protein
MHKSKYWVNRNKSVGAVINSVNSKNSERCNFCERKYDLKNLHHLYTQFIAGKWNTCPVNLNIHSLFIVSVTLISFMYVINSILTKNILLTDEKIHLERVNIFGTQSYHIP